MLFCKIVCLCFAAVSCYFTYYCEITHFVPIIVTAAKATFMINYIQTN